MDSGLGQPDRGQIDPDAKGEAYRLVLEADVVCFVEFSYHLENLRTLDLHGAVRRWQGRTGNVTELFGSAYGLDLAD